MENFIIEKLKNGGYFVFRNDTKFFFVNNLDEITPGKIEEEINKVKNGEKDVKNLDNLNQKTNFLSNLF